MTFPQYSQGNWLETVVTRLSRCLWDEYEKTETWLDAIKKLQGEQSVPLMTIHKSKGLEYDTVIFIGLEDTAFWNITNQADEELCSFFVALSRAKKRIIFTYSDTRHTGRNSSLVAQSNRKVALFYDFLEQSERSGLVEKRDFRIEMS